MNLQEAQRQGASSDIKGASQGQGTELSGTKGGRNSLGEVLGEHWIPDHPEYRHPG